MEAGLWRYKEVLSVDYRPRTGATLKELHHKIKWYVTTSSGNLNYQTSFEPEELNPTLSELNYVKTMIKRLDSSRLWPATIIEQKCPAPADEGCTPVPPEKPYKISYDGFTDKYDQWVSKDAVDASAGILDQHDVLGATRCMDIASKLFTSLIHECLLSSVYKCRGVALGCARICRRRIEHLADDWDALRRQGILKTSGAVLRCSVCECGVENLGLHLNGGATKEANKEAKRHTTCSTRLGWRKTMRF